MAISLEHVAYIDRLVVEEEVCASADQRICLFGPLTNRKAERN